MPKRTDIKKILIIGSGPIVIGQACEFDYSGTQACKALREEGYEVVLINSNPATIMTDPQTADRTYIEPITVEFLEKVIKKERPDAVLPTLGGQTGLNTAVRAAETGVLNKYGVQMIGASLEAIRKDPVVRLWGDRLIVTREEARKVVGSVIFDGKPSADGTCSIAYGVEEMSQGKGYATEALRASISWALEQPECRRIRASTSKWHKGSMRVLEKVGMTCVGEREDPDAGMMLVYEISREK